VVAGVEVFYALTAGDQTSPEGRLIRHMFQALDQVRGREAGPGSPARPEGEHAPGLPQRRAGALRVSLAARGASRPGAGEGGRQEVPPRSRPRAGACDRRDIRPLPLWLRLQGDRQLPESARWPADPQPRRSKRNTSGKWAKTTIKSMLENPTYTGRLYWNRLDSRAHKQGVGAGSPT
jgi:hypothetical protein